MTVAIKYTLHCKVHCNICNGPARQVDPAGADRGDQPLLAADQVLAVPAARPGHARRATSAPDDEAVIVGRARRAARRSTTTPDLVVIQVYITNAYRAYRIADHYRARGAFVALGGLHVTSLPDEAAPHADAIFLGPGEQTFPAVPRATSAPAGRSRVYRSTSGRTLDRRAADPPRPDRAPPLPRARTRSSSRAAARSTATSATRTRSSRAADRSTRSASTTRWPRSTGCPAGISTSSTITCSAIARFAARAVRRHARAWAGCSRAPATVDSDAARRPDRAGRRRRAAQPVRRLRDAHAGQPARAATSARTSAATTPRSTAACTTSAS